MCEKFSIWTFLCGLFHCKLLTVWALFRSRCGRILEQMTYLLHKMSICGGDRSPSRTRIRPLKYTYKYNYKASIILFNR